MSDRRRQISYSTYMCNLKTKQMNKLNQTDLQYREQADRCQREGGWGDGHKSKIKKRYQFSDFIRIPQHWSGGATFCGARGERGLQVSKCAGKGKPQSWDR